MRLGESRMDGIAPPARGRPEVWAGIECTVNRVGDQYRDQLALNGHATRIDDIDDVAALGVRTLRYPLLWERIAPARLDGADWHWADVRLERLREHGIRPIVGLLHHGSGPRSTHLLDPFFAERFAAYAAAVAARYPWLDRYTPINEPLTTARFSCLYGHWYPHARDDRSFVHALLAQCRATILAMRAIRAVNPDAQLVQTEDLAKTFATERLRYQADFENERRWLTWDLLCGRVDAHHALRGYLCWAGADDETLDWFVDNPCAPDVIGANHYLTSERYLDENLDRYPGHAHGGNLRESYADVEAVRACPEGTAGLRGLLVEAWQRYGLPLAVTEVHLGCTREEQMRWVLEAWNTACELRAEGVDVRAITAWALLGSFDWDRLLTAGSGNYEPGAFDVRAPRTRRTALARMIADLAGRGTHTHPVLDGPGWWRLPARLMHAHEGASIERPAARRPATLLVLGGTGTLGSAFVRILAARGLPCIAPPRQEVDLTRPRSLDDAIRRHAPWAVINAAGYVRVDDAEREPQLCHDVNAAGAAHLAEACARAGIPLVTFSSDLVFDGLSDRPYLERDRTAPLNAYGRSKAAAEAAVLRALPAALVVRTSAFFGPWDAYNFVTCGLALLAGGGTWSAAHDMIVSPTYVPDLVHAVLDLLIDGESGIWHVAGPDALSWSDLASLAAEHAAISSGSIVAMRNDDFCHAAARPVNCALGSERGWILPSLSDALGRYVRQRIPAHVHVHANVHSGASSARQPVQVDGGS